MDALQQTQEQTGNSNNALHTLLISHVFREYKWQYTSAKTLKNSKFHALLIWHCTAQNRNHDRRYQKIANFNWTPSLFSEIQPTCILILRIKQFWLVTYSIFSHGMTLTSQPTNHLNVAFYTFCTTVYREWNQLWCQIVWKRNKNG